MNTNNIGRRQLIITAAGAGLGALLTNRAAAQNAPGIIAPPAEKAGTLHQQGLREISEVLGNISISTKEGLIKLVNHLVKQGVISAEQAKILEEVINAIFSSVNADHIPDLNKMYDEIGKIYDAMKKGADDVAVAIVSIARDSVAYAIERLRDLDPKTALELVESDVEGAISGAATGAKFGPRGKIIGAIIGAVGSSGWEAFRRARKAQ
jgi:hypothetical protein